jgi:hypothetical protein
MGKCLILIFVIAIIFYGCALPGKYADYVPNEQEYWNTVKELDTPEKIADYMDMHFEYKMHLYSSAKTPYQFWLDGYGDCKDYAAFGVFCSRYHGYEAYIADVFFKGSFVSHLLAIYKEDNIYSFMDCWIYWRGFKTIDDCINWYIFYSERELDKYILIN